MCRGGMRYYDEYEACLGERLDIPRVEVRNIYCYAVPQVAGNMYRKDVFEKNCIKMPEGKMEDLAIFPSVALLSNKISYEDEVLYFYRINRKGSSMAPLKKGVDYIRALRYIHNEAKRLKLLSNCFLLMQISILYLDNALERLKPCINMELFSKIQSEFRMYLSEEYPGWTKFYNNNSWIKKMLA